MRTLEYLKCYKRAGKGLLTKTCGHRTKGKDFELKEDRFKLDIGRNSSV